MLKAGSKGLVEDDSAEVRYRVVVEGFHSSEEFVSKALVAVHPFDKLDVLPDTLKRKMHKALVKGPVWVQQSRARRWTSGCVGHRVRRRKRRYMPVWILRCLGKANPYHSSIPATCSCSRATATSLHSPPQPSRWCPGRTIGSRSRANCRPS